jgi:peptidyl-prolyl cis-trans isomerase SurA
MKFVKLTMIAALILIGVSFMSPTLVRAQEGEPVVVDEVIAQVNDGIVTLSQLKREMKERVQTMVQSGMPEPQATAEVEKKKFELIAILINEQLLLQKGKELDFTQRVEDEVNKRMLDVAKQNGIKTMDELCRAMKDSGLSCEQTRQTMRVEIMKQAVLESEVDSKVYFGFSTDDLHKYFDAHKDKFLKPESVDLSEIFLSLAGKPEADVKAQAEKLVAQLRGGADFCTLAAAYSERSAGANGQKPCKVGLFPVPDLNVEIATAIKDVKPGGVTNPIKSDIGYQILRLDARNSGNSAATFNENQVRGAMTEAVIEKERENYLQSLRNDGYINIAANYKTEVNPFLKIVPPAAAVRKDTKKPEGKGKFLGIIPKP